MDSKEPAMRLLLVAAAAIAAMLSYSLEAASKPSRKRVEVVGSVEVTNFPESPGRFELVGFTSDSFTGALGGPFGATEKCQAEFLGSRMCKPDEAQETTNLPPVRPDDAWVDSGSQPVVASVGELRCAQWLSNSSLRSGVLLRQDGAVHTGVCNTEHPVACCAPVP